MLSHNMYNDAQDLVPFNETKEHFDTKLYGDQLQEFCKSNRSNLDGVRAELASRDPCHDFGIKHWHIPSEDGLTKKKTKKALEKKDIEATVTSQHATPEVFFMKLSDFEKKCPPRDILKEEDLRSKPCTDFCVLCSSQSEPRLHLKRQRRAVVPPPRPVYEAPPPLLRPRSPEPEKQVRCEILYKITVKTGLDPKASSSVPVYLSLYGAKKDKKKSLRRNQLIKRQGSLGFSFQRGSTETFYLKSPDLGELKGIIIWHESQKKEDAWFLDEIHIRDLTKKRSWKFVCNNWLSLWHGDGEVRRKLVPIKEEIKKIGYKIATFTGDHALASFKGSVHLKFYGKKQDTRKFLLKNYSPKSPFERSQRDDFLLTVEEFGDLKGVRIEHDGGKSGEQVKRQREIEPGKFCPCCGGEIDIQDSVITSPRIRHKRCHEKYCRDCNMKTMLRRSGRFPYVCYKCKVTFKEDQEIDYQSDDFHHACHSHCDKCDTDLSRETRERVGERDCLSCHNKIGIEICGACRGDTRTIKAMEAKTTKPTVDWFLERLVIKATDSEERYDFAVQKWIGMDMGEGRNYLDLWVTDAMKDPGSIKEHTKYEIKITTGKKSLAGTDSTINVQLIGTEGKIRPFDFVDEDKTKFERGATDVFQVSGKNPGPLQALIVSHDNKGVMAGWMLDTIVVIRYLSGREIYRWLDDMKIQKKLPQGLRMKSGKVTLYQENDTETETESESESDSESDSDTSSESSDEVDDVQNPRRRKEKKKKKSPRGPGKAVAKQEADYSSGTTSGEEENLFDTLRRQSQIKRTSVDRPGSSQSLSRLRSASVSPAPEHDAKKVARKASLAQILAGKKKKKKKKKKRDSSSDDSESSSSEDDRRKMIRKPEVEEKRRQRSPSASSLNGGFQDVPDIRIIRLPYAEQVEFPCNNWLAKDEGDKKTERELKAGQRHFLMSPVKIRVKNKGKREQMEKKEEPKQRASPKIEKPERRRPQKTEKQEVKVPPKREKQEIKVPPKREKQEKRAPPKMEKLEFAVLEHVRK